MPVSKQNKKGPREVIKQDLFKTKISAAFYQVKAHKGQSGGGHVRAHCPTPFQALGATLYSSWHQPSVLVTQNLHAHKPNLVPARGNGQKA